MSSLFTAAVVVTVVSSEPSSDELALGVVVAVDPPASPKAIVVGGLTSDGSTSKTGVLSPRSKNMPIATATITSRTPRIAVALFGRLFRSFII